MVTKLGIGGRGRLLWSESMSADDNVQAEAILAQAYERVLTNLRKHEARLAALADALTDRQELPGDEVRAILAARTTAKRPQRTKARR
jgi:ATP-dependent Zn protease